MILENSNGIVGLLYIDCEYIELLLKIIARQYFKNEKIEWKI
jgi:hypothetical protein